MKKRNKNSKLIKALPFVPLIITFLFCCGYFAFNIINPQEIMFSPLPPELPQFNPPVAVFNFTAVLISMFVVSIIFMLIVFYFLMKRNYYEK